MLTIKGYHITEEVYQSTNSLVYRGYRIEDSQAVIFKILNQAYPSPERMAWFKREYEVTRQLDLPGVVKVFSLEHKQKHWMMILEDFGGQSLASLEVAGKLSLTAWLTLAIKIVNIMGQIHSRHVIHKDINPANIILNPQTGEVKIIDFEISTVLSREKPTFRNPNVLEGTLAYISPEQTGRMNRAIDYRTDFYSLGVTFYHLLTGRLPFVSQDALELVHSHIAKPFTPPHQLKSQIPPIVSEIILKLMSKNAEDRYQSAYGLKADLEECLRQWERQNRILPFQLAQHDISDQFQISQKLYGRQEESASLLAAFERVANGASEIMLVTGYPGVGKSALVQELYKPITQKRAYFISGKFDQLHRNTASALGIPYFALIQAFRSLIRQLLTKNESRIAGWRKKLLAALGANGQVLLEVIPEVELIIGPQPEVAELGPLEAQNRFNFVFQNFIKVFSQPEHPLVLFLDDLQWADGASLKLIESLISAPDSQYLFLIGTYRKNEVGEAAPLMLTLNQIKKAGVTVNESFLSPLKLPHITQLLCDTFSTEAEQVQPLAEMVLTKTHGNPFFLNEFLKSLYHEALITFNHEQGLWQWNLGEIKIQGITDNVVELMAHKVQKLPAETQSVLKFAACIGHQFDLQSLAALSQQSFSATAQHLSAAISQGLLFPLSDAYKLVELDVQGLSNQIRAEYKFAHDRVQQAVYSLIPQPDQEKIHWQIGQFLLAKSAYNEQEEPIFDVVNQLNQGRAIAKSQAERKKLAKLNLLAGQRAKHSAAYEPALNYLQLAIELLGEEAWQQEYELTLTLYSEAVEAAFSSGQFEQMDELSEVVLRHAKGLLDQVKVNEVKLQAYLAKYKIAEAIQLGLEVLAQLGIHFPQNAGPADMQTSLAQTKALWHDKAIEQLIDLPPMTNPYKLAAMRIAISLSGAASLGAPAIYPLILLQMVNLSIKYGHTSLSNNSYAAYGLFLCGVVGDIEAGYRFGKLALRLLEEQKSREVETKTHYVFNTFVRPWKEHIRETIPAFLVVYQSGLETGDLVYAATATFMYGFHSFWVGQPLPTLAEEMAKYNQVMSQQLKQPIFVQWNEIHRQTVLSLLGKSEGPCSLSSEGYDEEAMLSRFLETNDRLAAGYLTLNKLMLCYLFEAYSQAASFATKAQDYLSLALGMQTGPIFNFYDSLTCLALYPSAQEAQQKELLARVVANQEKMALWVEHGPMNHQHKFYLVEAERARLANENGKAREYYDQAIELAAQHQYTNEEALANELAAKFYLSKERLEIAHLYLRHAHYAYQRWGAVAKVKALEERYPQLLNQSQTRSTDKTTIVLSTSTTSSKRSSHLDLTSVVKASQAISGEIVLETLLSNLIEIVLENAGAERGFLILPHKDKWLIQAEGEVDQGEITVLQALPIEKVNHSHAIPILSHAIVNYVIRTQESVVLNDALHEGAFTHDSYIMTKQPKSILCAPLLNQGRLTGLLYLENNLTTGAFTEDGLEVLNLLSSQAAISIENAQLYSNIRAVNKAYERFVPRQFLSFLGKDSIIDVKLGDQVQKEMTILFSDIRDFTSLSEKMTPAENFRLVNGYLSRMEPVIIEHHGFVDKYIGDSIMALFPTNADDALQAAISMSHQLRTYNLTRQRPERPPLRIGIGLHTGLLMLGTVGGHNRMDGTVISDAVNLGSRVEGLTKLYGVTLLITQQTYAALQKPSRYAIREIARVAVKGKSEPVTVLEVLDADEAKQRELKKQTLFYFKQALALYRQRKFMAAQALFKQVWLANPQDNVAKLYIKRCLELQSYRLPADWNGVDVLTTK